jgi:hypothetical protein
MMRSSQYGSIIKHLEPEHLSDIPVPLAADRIRRSVGNEIDTVFRLRDEAFEMIRTAEEKFSSAVGVLPMDALEEAGYSVSSLEISSGKRRIDGYHYNPQAAAVLAALRQSGRSIVPLHSVVEDVLLPERFARSPAPRGEPFLDSEDIFKINPEITKFVTGGRGGQAAYRVKRNWILLARSGQLYGINGSTMLANAWHENKIISEHIIRVITKNDSKAIRPGYLQMALGHPVFGRPLMLRLSFGTSVPEISPEDVKDFPVVRLRPKQETEIGELVEGASTIRMEADEKENAAVQVVEKAIHEMLGEAVPSELIEPPVAPAIAQKHA